jgi:hypothetical protein
MNTITLNTVPALALMTVKELAALLVASRKYS